LNELKKRNLSYIIPLKRNSLLIPKSKQFTGVFSYDGKLVKYWKRENEVYIFEGSVLKNEEEKDFLTRCHEKGLFTTLT